MRRSHKKAPANRGFLLIVIPAQQIRFAQVALFFGLIYTGFAF